MEVSPSPHSREQGWAFAGARLVGRFLADEKGSPAVEFALLLPVMVLLVAGMVDYSAVAYQNMQVNAAAHAGAQYALRYGWNAVAIQTAVTSATGLIVTATPAPRQTNACVTNGLIVTTAGSTCPSGGAPGTYVTVQAQTSVTPIVAWSVLAVPKTLSAQAVVRIK